MAMREAGAALDGDRRTASQPFQPADVESAECEAAPSGRSRCAQLQAVLDQHFCISERGSTVFQEIRAGTTGFFATSNNFALNASILGAMGLDAKSIVVSSAFVSGISSIASGLSSNLPLGIMTSVGPNILLARLCSSGEYSLSQTLAISLTCGIVMTLLAITPALRWILKGVPKHIKHGLVIGTGLLTTLKGLQGIVITKDFSLDLDYLVSLDGAIAVSFLVLTATLLDRKVKGAMLLGMLGGTLTYWHLGSHWPQSLVNPSFLTAEWPDFSALADASAWMNVVSLTLIVLLSNSGGVLGSASMAGLLHGGEAPGSLKVFLVSGIGTTLSAFLGSSPVFVSMSASAGIRDGGRTGLVSVVIGAYSLLTAFFFSPIMSSIPKCALSPVLILVGSHMFREVREVDWDDTRRALPAFLCAILTPFTGSVGDGIYASIACSLMLFLTTGAFMACVPDSRQQTDADANASEPAQRPADGGTPATAAAEAAEAEQC